MLRVIDTSSRGRTPIPEGNVRNILTPSDDATRVHVAVEEVQLGKTCRIPRSDKTQVAYILEGKDAEVTFNRGGKTTVYPARRKSGVYLEPTEEATIKASGTLLVLLRVTVPKHTGKPIASKGDESPAGYFFEEAKLQSLVDERRMRTRTFWVNKETGLSGSWDMQIGRMFYEPNASGPRHVHHASKASSTTPEHFYLIEKGTGEVKHDEGSLSIGPGSLVLIPAGDWHQLIASDTGLDYIEFQAPFDFATTMDHDPLGKNWYIQDGTDNPKLWVQS